MRKHTEIYLKAFGYDLSDPDQYVRSELSDERGIDIHHIVTRENRIENLMMLTREQHLKYGDEKRHMVHLLKRHQLFLMKNGIRHDIAWFLKWIAHYEQD